MSSDKHRLTYPHLHFREPNPLADGNYPGFAPGSRVADGMRIDRDVEIPVRDGSVLYADVHRPADPGAAPLPVLISWGPYGKHGGRSTAPSRSAASGVDPSWVSPYAAIEAPDPLFWCRHGYAVIYIDPRGTWSTPGDYTLASEQEAQDFHDAIEWAGTRDWSNGKVGLSGVSYLSIAQWRVAATRPPHLAAINPWEGLTDFYRDIAYHGGIPETGFMEVFARHSLGYSSTRVEDLERLAPEHPFDDAYWDAKRAVLENVEVPAYVVASWSNQGLHGRGTLEGFKRISSAHKWLEVHGRKTWEYYYRPENVASQLKFFDWALKGEDNGWTERPKVLTEVRERANAGYVAQEREWPIARTEYVPLHLDAATGTLADKPPLAEAEVSYPVQDGDGVGGTRFTYRFTERTRLTGHAKLRLWLEARGSDDADVFVALRKRDATGQEVPFPFFALYDNGPVALGWLRASHRALDEQRSTPWQPWHPHDREELLEPGVPVALDIEIWPSSTLFEPGESLEVVVQAGDVVTGVLPGHRVTRNAGDHIIRTGGRFDSHLLVPVVADE
ncbi:CocE/NonD family hydrolase [Streptomyces lavenduligriseus]|uniref:CocE/NonD family hydrolase n=1 Tax=Streptomyces lavenduligriseus TaxID=67315 RepID=A0ABT0NZV2_9ACTN|nr:CocE/NonD family hydrolase [Streptomyces lavenduligriseus]MCL3997005.1 CocE/NonD family hydrolase [Streptomyces lavenduligriseus]